MLDAAGVDGGWPFVGCACALSCDRKSGAKTGKSGCMLVAFISNMASKADGRLVKYFRFCEPCQSSTWQTLWNLVKSLPPPP